MLRTRLLESLEKSTMSSFLLREEETSPKAEKAYLTAYNNMSLLARVIKPSFPKIATLVSAKALDRLQEIADAPENDQEAAGVLKLALQFFSAFDQVIAALRTSLSLELGRERGFDRTKPFKSNVDVKNLIKSIIAKNFKPAPGSMTLIDKALTNLGKYEKKPDWADFLAQLITLKMSAKASNEDLKDLFGSSPGDALLVDMYNMSYDAFLDAVTDGTFDSMLEKIRGTAKPLGVPPTPEPISAAAPTSPTPALGDKLSKERGEKTPASSIKGEEKPGKEKGEKFSAKDSEETTTKAEPEGVAKKMSLKDLLGDEEGSSDVRAAIKSAADSGTLVKALGSIKGLSKSQSSKLRQAITNILKDTVVESENN
jgi:hypothetical protein